MYSGASSGDENRDPGELGLFSFTDRVMLDQHLVNIFEIFEISIGLLIGYKII